MFKYIGKKYLLTLSLILILALGLYFLASRTLCYIYLDNNTNTRGFSYIGAAIKDIDKALNYAKRSAKAEGKKFKYIFKNAYGSGFIKNNPISNDLDFAVGIDLGKYNYTGDNSKEIAKNVIDKMDSFQYWFHSYINTYQQGNYYFALSQLDILRYLTDETLSNARQIASSIDDAVKNKDYIKRTYKTVTDDDGNNISIFIPFVMRKNTILIENYSPITTYSDKVTYSPKMKKYLREITIIPEFFLTINYKGKDIFCEIVPESFVGQRMQLSRRFFATTVFVDNLSAKYVKNLSYIKNDDEYFETRMISYKRHLQEITNIEAMKDRTIKMFKRIMQTANIIYPMLDKKTYREIESFVYENLNNPDVKLLNEYNNIASAMMDYTTSPRMLLTMIQDGKITKMYDLLRNITYKLEKRGKLKPENMAKLKQFQEDYLGRILRFRSYKDISTFRNTEAVQKYKELRPILNTEVYDKISDTKKLEKYIKLFSDIYTDAGYHRITLYWLDENTIGILEDDFTKNITDLDKFAKENDILKAKYKIISEEQAPKIAARYGLWARYNSSDQENKNYIKLKRTIIKDKKNYNIKRKFVFIK